MKRLLAIAAACAAWAAPAHRPEVTVVAADRPVLRVCADPDNLPFTNERGEGFENHLAERLAGDLGARLEYTWWAQRRGFLRHTLRARACDVVMGLPAGMDGVRATRPYYRSTYVFVERAARARPVRSLDDSRLRRLRIAVPLVGDDGANAPPAHALARRGLAANLIGYSVYGDGRPPAAPARSIAAVAAGTVDIAAAWGPSAGYFAARHSVPLRVTPIEPQIDGPMPLAFDIAMAVRRDDAARHAQLDAFLERHRREIDAVLTAFHVPRVDGTEARR
jgi:mxaJ protein